MGSGWCVNKGELISKETIKIILIEEKTINGKLRKPEYTLLEGVCAKGITASNINKAIQMNQAKVLMVEEKVEVAEGGVNASKG